VSEQAWGDEETVGARTKRTVPKWVWWGCGGGCLVATLIVALVAVFMLRTVRESMDPEKQWPKLAEILHFDERPDLELQVGIGFAGVDRFILEDRTGERMGTVLAYPPAARGEFDKFLSPDGELPFGMGRLREAEEGTITVQGREVPAVRFTGVESEPNSRAAGIRIDLTGSGAPRGFELRHSGSERVEDADVESFLARFDVWRGR
jgi:hypothetical protein